jgi:hypothetical protein
MAEPPRGFGFTMQAFIDADHATDSMTCISRTGFLVFLNSALIYWLSTNKQTKCQDKLGLFLVLCNETMH